MWDARSGKRLSNFHANWDIGGRRLAISEDGKFCAVGAYQRHGITLHDSIGGKELWNRKDLRKVQHLKFSIRRNAVLAGIDQQAFRAIDTGSGSDLDKFAGVQDVWENPFGDQIFREKKSGDHELLDLHGDEEKIVIRRTSRSVLDACFSENRLAVSEAGGATSCYSLKDGSLAWKWLDRESHNLRLAYSKMTNEVIGLNQMPTKGGGTCIVALNMDTGMKERKTSRDLGIASFVLDGSCVITWEGDLIDTSNGEIVSHLAFEES